MEQARELFNEIRTDTTRYEYIASIQQQPQKIFNPQQDEYATDRLLDLRNYWHKQGQTTIITTGVFDMLHPDHMGYLAHVKSCAAGVRYEQKNPNKYWSCLNQQRQEKYIRDALADRALRLIVSVDGDESVKARKGSNPEKGGAPTPVLAWHTRANMLAGQSILDPNDVNNETILPVVDAITIHGPNDFGPDSIHSSHFGLVSHLQPEAWGIYGESEDILNTAPHVRKLANIALVCVQNGPGKNYFSDQNIGKLSTTGIIQRIQGKK